MDVSPRTREGLSQAEESLSEEVERLMDDVAPSEADTAALYVETPESFLSKGSDERAFGIPGAGRGGMECRTGGGDGEGLAVRGQRRSAIGSRQLSPP